MDMYQDDDTLFNLFPKASAVRYLTYTQVEIEAVESFLLTLRTSILADPTVVIGQVVQLCQVLVQDL